jgi:oligopeptide transport system substrate-binding protein
MHALKAAIAAAAMLAASACGLPEGDHFGPVNENPDPTHLRWCNSGEPEYIDPGLVTSTTGVPIAHLLFDGLSEYDMDGTPKRSLAVDWEASEDSRTFTFKLRRDARWSNGRPLTAHDFRYHLTRILQPETGSRNAEQLWRLKNGRLYNRNRVRLVTADSPPFRAGDIVELLGATGHDDILPNTNDRTSLTPLRVRDLGAPESEAYETIPAGAVVRLLEIGGEARDWAYIYYAMGGADLGIYGWVPLAQLDGQPNARVAYQVREIAPEHKPGENLPPAPDAPRREGTVSGENLVMLPEILGIRVPDDHTLVLETYRPSQHMFDLSSSRLFRPTPREAVSRYPRRWTEPDKIVTSGPFHLEAWYERDRMELVKSQTFWDRDNIKLERFTSFSLNDQAASANYYRTGGCSAITSGQVPSSFLPVLSGVKRGGKPYKDYTVAPYLGIYYMMMNVEKLDNKHFRRALNYATDRTAIPKMIHGGEIPTAQFNPGTPIARLTPEERTLCGVREGDEGVAIIIEPGESCYVPPQGLDFDVERALEELAIAREQMGDDFPQSFTIRFNTGVEGHMIIAQYLQHEWRRHLGLDVRLQSQEWKTYLQSTIDGDFEVARMGWIGSFPSPSEMMRIFLCGAPNNRTRWCHPDFERYYEEGLLQAQHQKRLDYMRKAEEVLLQDAPIIPLYVYTQKHLQKPYVRDLAINFPDNVPHHRAWIDPNWRQREAE